MRVIQAHARNRRRQEKYLCERFLANAGAQERVRAEAQSKLARKRARWVLANPEQVEFGELDRARRMVAVYQSTDELERRIRADRVAALRRSVAKVERLGEQVYGCRSKRSTP